MVWPRAILRCASPQCSDVIQVRWLTRLPCCRASQEAVGYAHRVIDIAETLLLRVLGNGPFELSTVLVSWSFQALRR